MGEFRTNVQDRMLLRLGGLCGILGSVLALGMVFAATVISPWFRWDTNALSELGGGEVSLIFNSAVIVGGVLNFIFALGVRKYLSERRVVRIGAALIMLSSVCLAFVGVFTIAYHFAHAIASLGYFVSAPIGFILIGLGTERGTIRTPSIVTGIAALLAILILPMIFLVMPFKVGFAVPEDPATGSGNGCLAGYLVKHRYFGKDRIDIRVEQGYEIGRPSLLLLKAEEKGEGIDVYVGGKVAMVAKGQFI